MNKKKLLTIYHVLLSLYMIVCTSFFFNQYCDIAKNNVSNLSNLIYFIKDNLFLLVLFSIVFVSIVLNLFYVSEYWIFVSKEILEIKRIVGFTYSEILRSFTLDYMVQLVATFLFSSLLSVPFLNYFKLPIGMPIIIAGTIMILVMGLIINILFWRCLRAYRKNKSVGLNITKKVGLVFQFSTSLMLLFVSLILFEDLNRQVSPYKNYAQLDSAWSVSAKYPESLQETMKIEQNPVLYRGDILNKLATTYEKHHDHMIVFYLDSHSSNTLVNLIFLNETALKLNNINTESVKRYQNTDTIPIITSDSQYNVGDQIHSEGLNYVIAEVVEKPFTFLGPSDYTELSSKDYQIAYFDISNINQHLQLTNSNFIDELFFMNLSEDEVEHIRNDLNEPTFKYQVSSIKSIQEGFYHQKMLMLASYLGVGMINMIFSLFGLICAVFVDIHYRSLDFALYQVVGYSKQYLIRSYLKSIFCLIFLSTLIGIETMHITLDLTWTVLGIGISILIVLVALLSQFITKRINAIQILNIIGGENV